MLAIGKAEEIACALYTVGTTILDDWELIHQYRTQATQACLDQLVCRHLPRVRALILPMVGHNCLADDLTQETFFRAMRSLSTFQGRAQFGTWLSQIAVNVVREYHRQQARRQTVVSDTIEVMDKTSHEPDHHAQSNETMDKIQTELLELPAVWREAVILVCIHGYSADEAAKICECSVTTLYWRIHQSRKRLKQRLADFL